MRAQETQKTEENGRGVDLNINIYYGGRGIIDDPTIYVINKMQEVLEELRVHVERYNLYDGKTNITTLPQTLKEADGIILATTVEWYGIGGYMQQFLDACWLYGDKETIAGIYMCPVVMSTTYGEREGKLSLAAAWEILGGLPCSGICGYIENTVTLEMNGQYGQIIEKKAENMYRTINQKIASFPASNKVMRQKVTIPKAINLTPQETEQLSEYVSDDTFVQRQKEDIQELTSMFRDMLDNSGTDNEQEYLEEFRKVFVPQPGFEARYVINIIFINNDAGMIENNIFLLLFFAFAITLLIASGNPNCANVISNEYVGIIILYKLIASLLTILVNIIFIIKPNNLVNKAPIIKINVDLTNLFFIIKYMLKV